MLSLLAVLSTAVLGNPGERWVHPLARPLPTQCDGPFVLLADGSLATVDADGVALAAIQGLNEKFDEQTRLKDARIQQLEATVEELKALVGKLAAQQNGGGR